MNKRKLIISVITCLAFLLLLSGNVESILESIALLFIVFFISPYFDNLCEKYKKRFSFKRKIVLIIITFLIPAFTYSKKSLIINNIFTTIVVICILIIIFFIIDEPLIKHKKNRLSHSNNIKKEVRKPREYIYFKDKFDEWLIQNMTEFGEEYEFYKLNCCPNCGVVLEKKVNTTKNCPACHKKIIIRTNYLNKARLLLSSERLLKYEKSNALREEILFMENQMEELNNIFHEYFYKFYELKKEKPYLSARDYTWTFENWLLNEIDVKYFKLFKIYVNYNYQDRILKCFDVVRGFERGTLVFRKMIYLAKYKNKDNVLIGMILSLIYRDIDIAYLPITYGEYDCINDDSNFYFSAGVDINLLIDFMDRTKLSFVELKDIFFTQAHSFIFGVLSKEEAWNIFIDTYRHYLSNLKKK